MYLTRHNPLHFIRHLHFLDNVITRDFLFTEPPDAWTKDKPFTGELYYTFQFPGMTVQFLSNRMVQKGGHFYVD